MYNYVRIYTCILLEAICAFHVNNIYNGMLITYVHVYNGTYMYMYIHVYIYRKLHVHVLVEVIS